MDVFRYVDSHELVTRAQIAEATRERLTDILGVHETVWMTEDEFESHVTGAITARFKHGLIERVPNKTRPE